MHNWYHRGRYNIKVQLDKLKVWQNRSKIDKFIAMVTQKKRSRNTGYTSTSNVKNGGLGELLVTGDIEWIFLKWRGQKTRLCVHQWNSKP